MTIFEGTFQGEDVKVGIVVARFNEVITTKLMTGAINNLVRHGVNEDQIDIYWVPSAFEIPFIAKKMVESQNYDGIITLGAVIRGATTHYELVTNEVSKGVAQISLESRIPIMFGVLATETMSRQLSVREQNPETKVRRLLKEFWK